MKGLFIPDITAEMFRNGYLESIEALMAEGEIYDIDYEPEQRWIPSGEKPPEKESYLVWMPFAPPKHRMTVAEYCGGYWNIKTPISAWMPLPKPYEEDSAE